MISHEYQFLTWCSEKLDLAIDLEFFKDSFNRACDCDARNGDQVVPASVAHTLCRQRSPWPCREQKLENPHQLTGKASIYGLLKLQPIVSRETHLGIDPNRSPICARSTVACEPSGLQMVLLGPLEAVLRHERCEHVVSVALLVRELRVVYNCSPPLVISLSSSLVGLMHHGYPCSAASARHRDR